MPDSYCAGIELYPTDRYLSFLPLAHIFETMVEHAVLASGGAVGFFVRRARDPHPSVFAAAPLKDQLASLTPRSLLLRL